VYKAVPNLGKTYGTIIGESTVLCFSVQWYMICTRKVGIKAALPLAAGCDDIRLGLLVSENAGCYTLAPILRSRNRYLSL